MKRLLPILTALLLTTTAFTQEDYYSSPRHTLKFAPAAALLGSLSLQTEYSLTQKHSFTAKVGLPLPAKHSVVYDDRTMDFSLKGTSFLVGFRTYLSGRSLSGFYLEPYFQYINHQSTGFGEGNLLDQRVIYKFNNKYESAGIGAQLGYQLVLKEKYIIDLFFFGPGINSAVNSFSALETTNKTSWTSEQSADAQRDIRDFTNKFPFLKGRFDVMVDDNKRQVDATFIGTLPAIRTGVSVGIAF